MQPKCRAVFAVGAVALCVAGSIQLTLAQERGIELPAQGRVELAFTPEDDASGLLVQAIGRAKTQILLQAFSFTNKAIARALMRAASRDVEVIIIADREQFEKGNAYLLTDLKAAGIAVFIDGAHAAAHNKVMIIDAEDRDAAVITGSFNFTLSAQKHNAENVLILRGNPALTKAYADNWSRHRAHSTLLD